MTIESPWDDEDPAPGPPHWSAWVILVAFLVAVAVAAARWGGA